MCIVYYCICFLYRMCTRAMWLIGYMMWEALLLLVVNMYDKGVLTAGFMILSKIVAYWQIFSKSAQMCSVFCLRNLSFFVSSAINRTHCETAAQVRMAVVKILCRKNSTISVNLRPAQFSHNHALRLILSVHRQAWSFHRRANLAHCVATATRHVNLRWQR